jgi:SET domain-containing protein
MAATATAPNLHSPELYLLRIFIPHTLAAIRKSISMTELNEGQLEVRQTNIPGAGKGLFTSKDIKRGTRIIEYKGRIRTWKEVEHDADNPYIFYVADDHVIDASNAHESLGRYINDAKGLNKIKGLNNNAQFVHDGRRVFIEATRDIPAGSEIFVSYGKEYWHVMRQNQKL